ncbi:GmrSD restriction endonuclease domain-containing protein [Dyella sp.]|uniref:GmrSD restriction endonuclease domain-containing protein n=1 Tax=Dyella sp. TaxID=1869338 RepID=UPI003F81BB16
MALRTNLVNLDAMIAREDFAISDGDASSFENVSTISIREFTKGGLIGPSLRKPDFQRETNHWSPEQVVSLLDCFINGDLIPSVILWQSPTHLFVIDGGHRLSVLRAWIEDDYGDGHISQPYFGYAISEEQRKNAERTRKLVASRVGTWAQMERQIGNQAISPLDRKKFTAIVTRGLPIQWVKGDADKAEASFFKINTKGTPLDSVEELLLRNRHKPIAIAARAIIRAGKGHRYWSSFDPELVGEIEKTAQKLHKLLFDPEVESPIKTLDLPLGGPKGVRSAIEALIDIALIANRDQAGNPQRITQTADDFKGADTVSVLRRTLRLCERITGTSPGSLGLHPAVYFYGPTGRHSNAMFMGTMDLFGRKLSNNDKDFFKTFTRVRWELETILISSKDLIATILQRNVSSRRVRRYADLLDELIRRLSLGESVSDEDIVSVAGLDGKVVVGSLAAGGERFNDDAKSQAFISVAIASAMRCPICRGYLDPQKSASYDHIVAVTNGGTGDSLNCQITHPYCNTAVKGGD